MYMVTEILIYNAIFVIRDSYVTHFILPPLDFFQFLHDVFRMTYPDQTAGPGTVYEVGVGQ